jgi:hypothetical protein
MKRPARSSLPGLSRQSILLRKKMDARVKPAHDGATMRAAVLGRRAFILLLAAAAWPLVARAQQEARIPRIALLGPGRSEGFDASRATADALVAGLRELGYREGQNIVIERGFGEANADRLRELAAELARTPS